MIKVKDVYLKYPGAKFDTIKGMNFEAKKNEIVGFLGPSGAGKSTLQKILTGVLRNYRGNVTVLNTEVNKRKNDFYENIGVDFEFPNFYGKFSAIENLNYFSSLYNKKTLDPMALLKRVGLESDASKLVNSFSKGMKMRLGFVRCLIHDPKILFLDEPTSGLDPANARILKDMILEEKEKGKTILLTTHNMHDAEEVCDRVAFIVDGEIKALDTPLAFRRKNKSTEVNFRYLLDGKETESICLLSNLGENKHFNEAIKNNSLLSIHSKEQTLEDVFISLTGRCLS